MSVSIFGRSPADSAAVLTPYESEIGCYVDESELSFTNRLMSVLKAWVNHPTQVATVVPSSRRLIENIADRDCVKQAKSIIELGPGAGGTTIGLLTRMRPDANLLAIEKTAAFDEVLSRLRDPRLTVEIADATNLLNYMAERSLGRVDVVVSGIPFSSIPSTVARRIVQSVYESLQPGGTFIAYQLHNDVEKYARPLFGPSDCETVLWNLPPLKVFSWRKI